MRPPIPPIPNTSSHPTHPPTRSDQASSDPSTWGGSVPTSYENSVSSASSGKYAAARFVIFCMPAGWNSGGRANGNWEANADAKTSRYGEAYIQWAIFAHELGTEWAGCCCVLGCVARRSGCGRVRVRYPCPLSLLLIWMPHVRCFCSSHTRRTQPRATACRRIRVIRRHHIFRDIRR